MSPLARNRILKSPGDIAQLAKKLYMCAEVAKFDTSGHGEAWALAETFGDLENMFRGFLEDELPKLIQAEGEELSGLLIEIGVDLQHILYHIIDHQKFYKYLVPEGTEVFGKPDAHD